MERQATRNIFESTPAIAMAVDPASCATQTTEEIEVEAAKSTVARIFNHYPADIVLSHSHNSSITVAPLVAV
jgi:hypothetical protein